jgi:hypothetical protein
MDVRELTLDPDDWDEMRNLGHFMIDDLMTFLESIRDHTKHVETVSAIGKKIANENQAPNNG